MRLLLASTSRYRRELLERLRLPFEALSPGVDETPHAGEAPAALAARLAASKAHAVAARARDAIVIGSDQVAELGGEALGKPGNRDTAIAQLSRCSGRTVDFLTAVYVVAPGGANGQTHLDRTRVVFRPLQRAEIVRYVDAEQPFDCAGSFRCEGLGIALFERIETTDPTALIGLPLIATAALLRRAGIPLP